MIIKIIGFFVLMIKCLLLPKTADRMLKRQIITYLCQVVIITLNAHKIRHGKAFNMTPEMRIYYQLS
jgi:hypothetical protein